jgi:transposase
MNLQQHQWRAIEKVVTFNIEKRGKKHKNMKGVLEGVLWVMRTQEAWASIPRQYAPYSSCYKCYRNLINTGKLEMVLWILALQLKDQGADILYMFEDGRFKRDCDREKLVNEMVRFCNAQTWEWYTLQIFINPYLETRL